MIRILPIYFGQLSTKVLVLADQMMVSGFTLLLNLLVAHRLSMAEFGTYAAVQLVLLMLLAIQQSLVSSPLMVVKSGTGVLDEQTTQQLAQLVLVIFLTGVILAGCIWGYYLTNNNPLLASNWHWIVLSVGTTLVQDYQRRVFLAKQEPQKSFVLNALCILPQVLVLAALLYASKLSFSTLFICTALGSIPALIWSFFVTDTAIRKRQINQKAILLYFRETKWLFFSAMLQWWAGNSFMVAGALILGTSAFAALRLTQTIMGAVTTSFQAIENYLMPAAAVVHGNEPEKLFPFLKQSTVSAGYFILPALAALVVFAQPVMALAGGKSYIPYAAYLQGISILYVVVFIGYPVRIALRVLLLNKAFFTGYVISSLFSISASHIFVKTWGATGVIGGLIANQLLMLGWWLHVLKSKNRST